MPKKSRPKQIRSPFNRDVASETPALPESIIPPPGLTLLHTWRGHTSWVNSVEWSPDGTRLASGSYDKTVRVWNATSGQWLHTLRGHTGEVCSVGWSPDGMRLASGSDDKTVRVWNATSGRRLETLQGHTGPVLGVRWSPDGTRLATDSYDKTVRVWDVASGQWLKTLQGRAYWFWCVEWSPDGTRLATGSSNTTVQVWDAASWQESTLQGHTGEVCSVAWSPDGTRLASGSDDKTVRVWDMASGQRLQTLQGHTDPIASVEWSPDGTWLATSTDLYVVGEVRIWRTDTWEPVTVLTGLKNSFLLAWHPRLPQLVTSGQQEHELLLWQLDLARLLNQAPLPETVHYKTAKVVLVGESGVGKSGLSLVLTGQPFAPTESTHGRHVWRLDTEEVALDSGIREQREMWLWDLAGQHDYRLIHQLHLHEATVALIVFDALRDTDPLAGIHYWQHALHLARQARGSSALPLTTFLVAARMDRGGRGVSRERIETLVRELGCAGYIETSAKTDLGIAELSQAIRSALAWDTLPSVTSTKLLQDIQAFLLGEVQTGQLLRTVDALYQAFLRVSHISTSDASLPQQFETVLGQLEAQGVLRRLSFGNLVLLQPERLDAYASALLIAVRNEPDGLGIIAEEYVRQGRFAIPEEDRLKDSTQEHLLLIAMIEELVRHELVLREGGSLLFPSQSTREHPEQASLAQKQSVTFRFAGPTLSIYTRLVVRLAQSGIFQKQELWQHVVTYTTRLGGSFGVLLTPRGEERAELGLFFDEGAHEHIRFHFEDFVQTHLKRYAIGTVQRQRRFVCPQCGGGFTEQQIVYRRDHGFDFIRCSACDTKVSLLDGMDWLTASRTSQVQAMEQTVEVQLERQSTILTLEGKRATQDFDVFLCHNSQDKAAVKQIGEHLMQHGILPWLDEWELRPGQPWQRLLEQQIEHIKAAAVFVGKDGFGPWQHHELDAFLREFAQRKCPVIPVLLKDAPQKPELPVFLRAFTWVDFRQQEPDPTDQLIWGITGVRNDIVRREMS